MQSITLTFYERVHCWIRAGNHQVRNLKEASVWIRLIDRIRPTDDEMRETEFLQDGPQCHWSPPSSAEYGRRTFELEEVEANELRATLDAAEGIAVKDAAWMTRLRDQLPGAVNESHTTHHHS
jgi:hypothetical protein